MSAGRRFARGRGVAPEPERAGADAQYPQRRTASSPAAAEPNGWRASKRSTKLGKKRRREVKLSEAKERLGARVRTAKSGILGTLQIVGIAIAAAAALGLVFIVLATGVNAAARWLALNAAERAASPEAQAAKARENLLIIGADGGGSAEFLAVRLDEKEKQILGIAIPSGAFMDVPGQGFERVGDSYAGGPTISTAAVSNYLGVPFEHYVVVDVKVYQDALTNQSLRDIMGNVQDTDLADADLKRITEFIATVSGDRTALVPLPVKPIDLGGQTFFEPQREQIADLLLKWWDVRFGPGDATVRVIVYNGAGKPGVAGLAAKQLITGGMRVVDTKNADRFDYESTLIVVQDGDLAQGERVKSVIGVGEVIDQPSEQDVADVILIIGHDYEPPSGS